MTVRINIINTILTNGNNFPNGILYTWLLFAFAYKASLFTYTNTNNSKDMFTQSQGVLI